MPTPEQNLKYTEFLAEPESSHNLVLGFVARAARVLEIGCATGYMSAELKRRLGCRVTGVELSPEAARVAAAHCDRVVTGNAEELDFADVFGEQRFDTILFADVLEHLRDPALMLRRVRPLLDENGFVVASIPNIAHASVRLALLAGEFRYRPTGLLDETHLRFFTRETIQDVFEGEGYVVTHWRRRRMPLDQTEITADGPPVLPAVREWLLHDPEATTYQFVVRAEPSETLAPVRARLEESDQRVGELEEESRAAREVAEHARAEAAGHRSAAAEYRADAERWRVEVHRQAGEIDELRTRLAEVDRALEEMKGRKLWRILARGENAVSRLRSPRGR